MVVRGKRASEGVVSDNLRETDDGTLEKRCSTCKEWRRIPEAFSVNLAVSDGFDSRCRRCVNTAHRDYEKRMPEEVKKKKTYSARRANYRHGVVPKFAKD